MDTLGVSWYISNFNFKVNYPFNVCTFTCTFGHTKFFFSYDMGTDVSNESLIALLCNFNEMWFCDISMLPVFHICNFNPQVVFSCNHKWLKENKQIQHPLMFSCDLFGTVLHCEQDSSAGKLSWSSSLQRYGNSLCSLCKSPPWPWLSEPGKKP